MVPTTPSFQYSNQQVQGQFGLNLPPILAHPGSLVQSAQAQIPIQAWQNAQNPGMIYYMVPNSGYMPLAMPSIYTHATHNAAHSAPIATPSITPPFLQTLNLEGLRGAFPCSAEPKPRVKQDTIASIRLRTRKPQLEIAKRPLKFLATCRPDDFTRKGTASSRLEKMLLAAEQALEVTKDQLYERREAGLSANGLTHTIRFYEKRCSSLRDRLAEERAQRGLAKLELAAKRRSVERVDAMHFAEQAAKKPCQSPPASSASGSSTYAQYAPRYVPESLGSCPSNFVDLTMSPEPSGESGAESDHDDFGSKHPSENEKSAKGAASEPVKGMYLCLNSDQQLVLRLWVCQNLRLTHPTPEVLELLAQEVGISTDKAQKWITDFHQANPAPTKALAINWRTASKKLSDQQSAALLEALQKHPYPRVSDRLKWETGLGAAQLKRYFCGARRLLQLSIGRNFTAAETAPLKRWLHDNVDHLFLTGAAESKLLKETGLSFEQLWMWLKLARLRISRNKADKSFDGRCPCCGEQRES